MEIENNWFAVEITTSSESSEAIEFALNELNALGTEINNLGKDKPKQTLCVVGYFNEQISDDTVDAQIEEALRIYDFDRDNVKTISWRAVENKDWLAEWKKHWQPTKTGKFVVAPTWSKIQSSEDDEDSQNQEIILRIDPEMAFGTGTHETTRLCLQAIEKNYPGDISFLDVGTGTGILAIAAAKTQILNFASQAKKSESLIRNSKLETRRLISACDTDENSIEIAHKNAELNQVKGSIDFYVGTIDGNSPAFDFVCANLTADVILPILPLLIEKARRKLVLSGILKEQESLIAGKLRELQISDFEVQTDGEWISILILKD